MPKTARYALILLALVAFALLGVVMGSSPCPAATQQNIAIIERLDSVGNVDDASSDPHTNHDRGNALFVQLLSRLGVKYGWGWDRTAKTEYCRTGIFPSAFGTSTARVDTVGAVIHWNFFRGTSGLRNSAYRPDSLLSSTKTLSVPQLAILTNFWQLVGSTNYTPTSSTACTTGVAAGDIKTNPTWTPWVHPYGSSRAFVPGTYVSGWPMSSYEPNGGRRLLLTSNAASYWSSGCVNCIQCDSLFTSAAGSDTASAWEIPKSNVTGSKPFTFVDVAGAGALYDSTGINRPPCENDPMMMLYALARLDSLMGGTLFDADRLPIKVGVFISGGFRHQSRASFNGGFVEDSATTKTSAAALGALGIPAVLGVNVDSVSAYPYEKAWWNAWSGLRYSPQSWCRVEDSTAVAGRDTAGVLHAEDVWGRLRSRTAYGPAYTSGADTSVYANLRYALDRLRALYPNRTSTALEAPLDDIIPANSGMIQDSVLYAVSRAGCSALIVNGRTVDTKANKSPNPRVSDNEQRTAYPFGQRLAVLAHGGFSQLGGAQRFVYLRKNVYPWRDTTCVISPELDDADYEAAPALTDEMQRVTAGLLSGRDYHGDEAYQDYLTNTTGSVAGKKLAMNDYQLKHTVRANIIRLCVNDLSGDPSGPPARNGYWLLKNLDNAFRIINAAAGRTVIQWAYPEDLNP